MDYTNPTTWRWYIAHPDRAPLHYIRRYPTKKAAMFALKHWQQWIRVPLIVGRFEK